MQHFVVHSGARVRTGTSYCLKDYGVVLGDIRITTGNTEKIEGESGLRGGNQRKVQGVSREVVA